MKPSTSVDEQSLDGLPEDSASTTSSTMSDKWTWSVHRIHAFLLSLLRPLVRTAATNPRRTVAGIAIMSLVFLVTGLMTNFRMELDEGRLWTPRNSLATHHSEYIADKYAGKGKKLTVSMIFHADGANVLGKESLQRMFDVLNDIQEADGYETFCGASRHLNDVSLPCSVWGAVKFWDADETLFHQQVQTDQDALATMSASKFPDGIPVSTESIFGHPVRDEETGLLKEAKSYTMHFMHPRYVKGSRPWGSAILQELLNRGTEWEMEDGKTLRMELLYPTSFSEEFVRAILVDIPLGK